MHYQGELNIDEGKHVLARFYALLAIILNE